MTAPGRFAIDPVRLPPRAFIPEELDRSDARHAWVTIGQASLAAWFVYGFGAVQEGPTTVLGLQAMLVAAFLLTAPRGTFSEIRISLPVLLFAIWWALSYRWAASPGNWWVKTKGEGPSMAVPIIICALLPVERVAQAFRFAFYIGVIWIFAATAADPHSTTTHLTASGGVAIPGWHGMFVHKNEMAFFLLLTLMAVLVFEPRQWLRWASALVTLALIVLGRSGTGITCFAALMALTWWLAAHRRQPVYLRRWFAVVSVFVGIALTAILVALYPLLLQLGGKDPTISGRTEIWESVWIALEPNKWLGFGPGGVWDNQGGEPTKSIVNRIGFVVFHSHNGPLELALRLGLVGVGLVLWITANAFGNAWRLQLARHDAGRWMIASLALVVITWSSENTMMGHWIGLIGALTVLALRVRTDLDERPAHVELPPRPRTL